MATTIQLIQRQVDIIVNIRTLSSVLDPKFQSWKQLTASIIDRRLGKAKLMEFYQKCNISQYDDDPWSEMERSQILNKVLNDAEAYLLTLIEEIQLLGEIENKKYTKSTPYYKPKIEMGDPGRNEQPGAGGMVFIQAENFHISGTGKITVNGGDYMPKNTSVEGKSHTVRINYGTIDQSTAQAIEKVNKIMEIIGNSELAETQKMQLIGNAEIVKASIIQPTPDKYILGKAWSALQRASTLSGVIQLINQIGDVVQPLLSN